ncbi:MAG: hypothetical protein IPG34_19860 [Rhodocyclaceae bacterium]|nr:hypothetical protein [Rhodocyclaceae bacterium]
MNSVDRAASKLAVTLVVFLLLVGGLFWFAYRGSIGTLSSPSRAAAQTVAPAAPVSPVSARIGVEVRTATGDTGPCAGIALDINALASLFAPALELDGQGAVVPGAKVTSDASFVLSPVPGVDYTVFLGDGTVRVAGGDPASAALLTADIEACTMKIAPPNGINVFGADGAYGPTISTN